MMKKTSKLFSSALLATAAMTPAFAETITLATNSSGDPDAGGSYAGISLKIDADWLTESGGGQSDFASLLLNSISIDGRTNQSWISSDNTLKLIVRVHDTGTIVAMSEATTIPTGTGAQMTFSNFTDYAGNAGVTLHSGYVYDFSFVSSSTTMATFTVTGGSFVSNPLAAYSNGNIGTTDTGYSFVDKDAASNIAGGYKASVSLSGESISANSSAGTGKILNLYVLTGQSNSLGAVKGSPLSDAMIQSHATTSDQVKFWHENFSENGTLDGASTAWNAVAPQAPTFNDNLCMGPEYGFSYLVSKKEWQNLLSGNDGDLGIVKVSRDGGGNSWWTAGNAAYRLVLQAVANAIAAAKEEGYTQINILGLMYQQGESNGEAEAANAGTRLAQLVADLKTDFGAILEGVTFSADYHVAAGENAAWNLTGEYSGNSLTTRDNLYGTVSETTDAGTTFGEWIPTHDLAKITSGDNLNVHYDGQSQLTIGARYAYAEALRAGYEETESIRNFNLDAALDSQDAYHSGKMSSTETVTWDIASATITKVSETDSSVKLHGIRVDADAGNYLQTGATRIEGAVSKKGELSVDDARLIIGEGGISIGKNLTLATNLGADATQTWSLDAGTTLQLDGALFVTLSEENLSTALITKEGAGTLEVGSDAALGIVLPQTGSWTAGEYRFYLFSGFSEEELSAFENGVEIFCGDSWQAATFMSISEGGVVVVSYIPEPSGFGLISGAGVLALVAVRRRRRERV